MKDNEKYLKLTFDEKKKTTDVSQQLNVQYKAERQVNVFTCLHSSVSMTTR